MGKSGGGFLTPKAIANRIKAKGMQKLRWYCQMCQKQCRDENGFKCHLTSESHQRQLLLFAENPDEYIDSFSREFFEGYSELLKRRFGSKRVHCNIVYQEYIHDREHVHMNSTQWETLTDYVKWLGKEGHAVVDQTEKGWFVQWIDRDPETIQKQESVQKKEKMDLDDQEKAAKFMQKQIERATREGKEVVEAEFTELKRESEDEKIKLSLGMSKPKTDAPSTSGISRAVNPLKVAAIKDNDAASIVSSTSNTSAKAGQKRKASALDEIMQMEEAKKEKVNRKDHWLHKNIIVKIVTKKIGDKYYKKKGIVKEVVDKYAAVVKVMESGAKIKVDQAHLETVIPGIGKPVLVVNGAYRGQEAILEELNEKTFSCSITIAHGPLRGREVDKIQYEDISKLDVR